MPKKPSSGCTSRQPLTGPCPRFCCSKFKRFQHDLSNLPDMDLSTPIHAVFVQNRFPSTLEQQEFDDLIVPSLRCVTQYVLSDAAVPFILALTGGDVFLDGTHKGNALNQGKKVQNPAELPATTRILRHPKQEDRVINEDSRQRARDQLDQMAKLHMIEFHISENGNPHTQGIDEERSQAHLDVYPVGFRSRIFIPRTILNQLRDAINSKQTVDILMNRWELAKMILHELAHAIGMAVDGELQEEAYYKNDNFSELGLAFENVLYGGVQAHLPGPQLAQNVDGRSMGFRRWGIFRPPFSLHAAMYKTAGAKFGERIPKAPHGLVQHVEISSIAEHFTNEFWEKYHQEARYGPVPLRTSTSWVMRVAEEKLPTTPLQELGVEVALPYEPCELDDTDLPSEWQRALKKTVREQQASK